jgi:hypothetical protein
MFLRNPECVVNPIQRRAANGYAPAKIPKLSNSVALA